MITSIRDGEIAGLWQALSANEGAVQRVFDEARGGMTPDEMEQVFEREVRRRGIDSEITGAAFVVDADGVGPKLRSRRPLGAGDMFGMDFQFQTGGFHSDIGRYGVLGSPSDDLRARHGHVLRTQQEVVEAIQPDHSLRRAFERCPDGWTTEVHRVGLEVHEDPRFSTVTSENDLDVCVPEGIVLCVEIWAGFDGGIEDEFLVTSQGLRRLTSLPRELAEVE